jgi:hypothetical protein
MIREGTALSKEVRPGGMFLFLGRMRKSPNECKERFGAGGPVRTVGFRIQVAA